MVTSSPATPVVAAMPEMIAPSMAWHCAFVIEKPSDDCTTAASSGSEEVGLDVGLDVGLGVVVVGLDVGLGEVVVGLGVGLDVGLGVGAGVGAEVGVPVAACGSAVVTFSLLSLQCNVI